MPETPVNWFETYMDYHRKNLTMTAATLDRCFVYSMSAAELIAVIGIGADDTICVADVSPGKKKTLFADVSIQSMD